MPVPILYLHGFASGPTSRKAQFLAQRLAAEGYKVTIADLAEGDFENLTITGQLRVIERHAGGAPVHLIGSSLGGYLACLYAARHPEVEKLVLLAPGFGFPRRYPEMLGAEAVERWRATGTMPVYHYADQCERPLGYGLVEDAAQYEDYPDVSQPTLILHGIHDDVVPSSLSERFAHGRSNVRVELLDSDHELLSVLETVWERTRDFLAAGRAVI